MIFQLNVVHQCKIKPNPFCLSQSEIVLIKFVFQVEFEAVVIQLFHLMAPTCALAKTYSASTSIHTALTNLSFQFQNKF